MATRWGSSLDFGALEEFRRRLDRMFEDFDGGEGADLMEGSWPKTRLADTGQAVVVTADVPGLTDKDVRVVVQQDVLTISGERRSEPPQGYTVHRRERMPVRFTRSISLKGGKFDTDKASAVVKNGVLVVTLPKSPETQPRQITVKAN